MANGSGDLIVLLVEDDPIISLDTSMTLRDLGADRVDTAMNLAEAATLIAEQLPTVAVMDIELRDGTTFSLADQLRRHGTSCVFTTGHGSELAVPAALRDLPVIAKPYEAEQLRTVLAPYLDRRTS